MKFHTTEKLGPKQSLTPEGFLLCEEVPLARTGMMIYGPNETPVEAGPDGLVRIFRDADEVFSQITLASANGKPVVNEHPDEDVVPDNWLQLAKGVCLNPRRGEGVIDDLMVADLLITCPEEIKAVQSGKREISLGYDANYEETDIGYGKQSDIIINHIALVEAGRCGPRCSIGDQKPQSLNHDNKEPEMATKKPKSNKFLDALMRAFKAKDADEVEALAQEVQDEMSEEGETHIHIHNNGAASDAVAEVVPHEGDISKATTDDDYDARIRALESTVQGLVEAIAELKKSSVGDEDPELEDEKVVDALEEEAVEGTTKDSIRKAKDSAFLTDSFKDTVSIAEILVPGIRVPTFDNAARPAKSLKAICNLRSTALDLAYSHPSTRVIIDQVLNGRTLDTKSMTCDAIRTIFRAAGALKKASNNTGAFSAKDNGVKQGSRPVQTIAELNKLHQEYYSKR